MGTRRFPAKIQGNTSTPPTGKVSGMRTTFFIAAWGLLALLLPAERSLAAPPTDKPYIFFSANPDENPDAAPAGDPDRQLNLRPNQEQPYFVYVHNPTGQKKTVLVQLVSKRKTGQLAVAAEKKSVEVGSKKTVRVQLEANKAQLPPPAPVSPDPKAALAPAPAIPLYGTPYFRAVADDDEDKEATIVLKAAETYASVEKEFNKEKNALTITVKRNDTPVKVGGPIPVRLIARNKNGDPIEPAKLAAAGNNLEGFLAIGAADDGAKEVVLTLNTKDLGEGFAEVSIDGSPRTKWYSFDGTIEKAFGVIAPLAAIPGKPIAVRFMGDDAPKPADGSDLRIVFNRTGTVAGEQIKIVPSPRNDGIDVRIGASGEAIFVTRAEDWVVEFPTQGVYGEREFFARSGTIASEKRIVMFDASPPTIQIEVEPAIDPEPANAVVKKRESKKFRPGERIKVTASAQDAESKIDPTKGARIYLGEKPGADGKPGPNGQVKVGKPTAGKDSYEAIFEIPANYAASELTVGAIFVNGVGLSGSGERTIEIDFTPPVISILAAIPGNPVDEPYQPKPIGAGYKPGDTVRFVATAHDKESGIDLSRPVLFFLGDPPDADGKPSQGTLLLQKAGALNPEDAKAFLKNQGDAFPHDQPLWAADIALPKDIKKETDLKIGVWFVNGVGLSGSRLGTVKIEFDNTVGTVKVKVVQGSDRQQPGVKVWLLDKFGKVAAEGETDDCGVATFEKVLPGTYTAWAVKAADQNAQAFKTVVVRGGETAEVPLSISRQAAPPIQPPLPVQNDP